MSPIRVPSTDIFNAGVGVTVCRCVGVVLAVNGEAVEGRSMSNGCMCTQPVAEAMFQDVLRFTLSYCSCLLFPFPMMNCLIVLLCVCVCGIRVTRKANFHFMYLL